MTSTDFCERCREQRFRSSLVRDSETGRVCCSNRAQCSISKARREARDEVDRLRPEPEGYAEKLARELSAPPPPPPPAPEPEPVIEPEPPPPPPPPKEPKPPKPKRPLGKRKQMQADAKAEWLAQRLAQHRKERES